MNISVKVASSLAYSTSSIREQDVIHVLTFVTRTISLFYSLVLLLIGVPGNILTVIVLRSRALRDNFLSLYLQWLAHLNIFCLIVELSRQICLGLLDFDYREFNFAVCIIHLWLTISSVTTCNWLLVVITAARWCYVRSPNRVGMFFRARNVHLSVIILLLFTLTLDFIMVYVQINPKEKSAKKSVHLKHVMICPSFKEGYSMLAIRLFLGLIPLMCLAVISIFIFCEVRMKMSSGRLLSLSHKRHGSAREKNLALLLVISNSQFLVTVMPITVFTLVRHRIFDESAEIGAREANLAYTMTKIMLYAGHATNCIIYSCFGSKFRSEMFKFLISKGLCPVVLQKQIKRSVVSNKSVVHSTAVSASKVQEVTGVSSSRVTFQDGGQQIPSEIDEGMMPPTMKEASSEKML